MSSQLERADKGVWGVLKTLSMKNTDRANASNRGVAEFKPSEIDAFFNPERGVYNALISGGDADLRTNALVAQAICASCNGFPVIILHEGNRNLEQQLSSYFSGTGKFIEISSSNPCFEPLYGLTEMEISNQVLETAPKEFDIKFNARNYIDGMSEYLNACNKHRSFKMFSTCPHSLIFDKVDDMEIQGMIDSQKAQEIKSKLMMGQSENFKLDTFFANLKMEAQSIMYGQRKGIKPANVIFGLSKGAIVCLDVGSVTNKLLMNTIVSQLKLALSRGIHYELMIDSIPICANDALASYIKSPSDHVCKTFAADDFFSMTGGDEKIFSAIIGSTQTLIVMNHSSGNSAMKWADVFGQYDKYEESYSTTRGSSKAKPYSIFSSPNKSRSVSISKNREYIVKPEMIARMRRGEAYVMAASIGQLSHICFTG